ncbi:hypothetical protein NL676_025912 [Syzygium grande]|nr:hypothetical protein NL676_025912 [Syzygium grande]
MKLKQMEPQSMVLPSAIDGGPRTSLIEDSDKLRRVPPTIYPYLRLCERREGSTVPINCTSTTVTLQWRLPPSTMPPPLTVAWNHHQESIATTDRDAKGTEPSPRPETNAFTASDMPKTNHPSNAMAIVVGLWLHLRR